MVNHFLSHSMTEAWSYSWRMLDQLTAKQRDIHDWGNKRVLCNKLLQNNNDKKDVWKQASAAMRPGECTEGTDLPGSVTSYWAPHCWHQFSYLRLQYRLTLTLLNCAIQSCTTDQRYFWICYCIVKFIFTNKTVLPKKISLARRV